MRDAVELHHRAQEFNARQYFELIARMKTTIRFVDRNYDQELKRCGSKEAMIQYYQSQLQDVCRDPTLKVVDVRDGSVMVDFHSPLVPTLIEDLTPQDEDSYMLGNDRVKLEISCYMQTPELIKCLAPSLRPASSPLLHESDIAKK